MTSERFDRVDEELLRFHTGTIASGLYTADWSTHEWLRFLQHLNGDITIAKMQELDAAFHFTSSENAEIEDVWFDLAIRRNYTLAYPSMENFLCSVGRRNF